jgi:hypothetical protein
MRTETRLAAVVAGIGLLFSGQSQRAAAVELPSSPPLLPIWHAMPTPEAATTQPTCPSQGPCPAYGGGVPVDAPVHQFTPTNASLVQHDPRIFLIFWGSKWATDSSGTMGAEKSLVQSLFGSSYAEIVSQYHDYGTMVHNNTILGGSWVDNAAPPSGTLQPQDFINEANNARWTNNWPDDASRDQYAIFTQSGADTWLDGKDCGAHFYGISTSDSLSNDIYIGSAVPYASDLVRSKCLNASPSGQVANAMTVIESHEWAEAATDPRPYDGWSTNSDYEIGDLCNYPGVVGPGGQYVQLLWSNAYGGSQGGACVSSLTPQFSYSFNAQTTPSPGAWQMANLHAYSGSLLINNTGNIAWEVGGNIVRLGTSNPQNRCSAFADPSWMNCGRIALSGNVNTGDTKVIEPNETGIFNFSFTPAPSVGAGSYNEYFDPLAEGISWMSTNAIRMPVTVGSYNSAWVSDSGASVTAVPGLNHPVEVTFRNTGTAPWYPNEILKLGTSHPHDRVSAFYDSATWDGQSRPDHVRTETDPGGTYTFTVNLKVPVTSQLLGRYDEFFNPVAEGETWLPELDWNIVITVL